MTNPQLRGKLPLLATLALLSLPALAVTAESLVGRVLDGHASKAPLTASEVKAMPPACITIGMGRIDNMYWHEAMKMNGTLSLLDQPENAMARDAIWFHHYCWAALSKQRHYSAQGKTRDNEIILWRSNLEFIVKWVNDHKLSWPYMPLVYRGLAEAQLAEKNYQGALASAALALKLNPRQAESYAIVAEIHLAAKNRQAALAAVTEGLKYAPNSSRLKRYYKELGGSLPLPEPYPAPEEPSPEAAKDVKPAVPATSSTTAQNADKPRPSEPAGPPPAPAAPPLTPKEGKPSPNCRFCP